MGEKTWSEKFKVETPFLLEWDGGPDGMTQRAVGIPTKKGPAYTSPVWHGLKKRDIAAPRK